MSAAITLASGEHMAQLLSLMARRAAEANGQEDDEATHIARQYAVKPLLSGGPEGAVWLIGPTRAPLGYAIVTFGWNLALGGREAWVEDVYVRPSVRRRSIGREVLHAIAVSLRAAEVRALQVRLQASDAIASNFCTNAGFKAPSGTLLMTDVL